MLQNERGRERGGERAGEREGRRGDILVSERKKGREGETRVETGEERLCRSTTMRNEKSS